MKLTKQEKKKLIELIESGKPLPAVYKSKLFDRDDTEFIEATKDYKLVYKGKARKEDIIAQTPAAPFQKIRSFNSDNVFDGDWQNMLIFGDNLMALKTIYDDQRGPNIYKTKNRIKLIYIDPPFATKQHFMKEREKAYRDKIIGAQFIEFLRKRLILLHEILAEDGSIYVHLDEKKGHYIKTLLDEIFGEHNFKNEISWKRTSAHSDSGKYGSNTDHIYYYTKNESYIWNQMYEEYEKKYLMRFRNVDDDGRKWTDGPITAKGLSGGGYEYEYKGIKGYWRCPPETMKRLVKEGCLTFFPDFPGETVIYPVSFSVPDPGPVPIYISELGIEHTFGPLPEPVSKPQLNSAEQKPEPKITVMFVTATKLIYTNMFALISLVCLFLTIFLVRFYEKERLIKFNKEIGVELIAQLKATRANINSMWDKLRPDKNVISLEDYKQGRETDNNTEKNEIIQKPKGFWSKIIKFLRKKIY